MLSAERMTERIAGLMARYTSRPSAPQTAIVSAWLDDLDDMSEEEIDLALRAHTRDPGEGRFWPTTAAIRGQLQKLRDVQQRQIEGPTLSAEEEWQQVIKTASRIGYYDQPRARKVLGETLWTAIGGGRGYASICQMKAEEIPSERARFCALRKVQVDRIRQDRELRPLLELIEGVGQPMVSDASRAQLRLVEGV